MNRRARTPEVRFDPRAPEAGDRAWMAAGLEALEAEMAPVCRLLLDASGGW